MAGRRRSRGEASKTPPATISPPIPPRPWIRPLRWDRREVMILLGLTLAAFLLRFIKYSGKSFWIDEFFTHEDAVRILSRPRFWTRPHFLYFILVRTGLVFGFYEWTLRLPSLLFGTLSIPAIYLYVKRWYYNRRLAFVAALLTCVSLFQIGFAHEARYYTTVTFFSALGMLFVYRLVRRPHILDFILVLLIGVLNFGMHPAAGLFLAIQMGFAVFMYLARGHWRGVVAWVRKGAHNPRLFILDVLIFLAVLAGLWCSWRYMLRPWTIRLLRRLGDLENFRFTRGVGFTSSFFLSPIERFGKIYGTTAVPWLRHVYNFWFFYGLYRIFRRSLWKGAFVVWAYLATYAALFLYDSDIPYTEKYVIFLYPLFAGTVAFGIWGTAGILSMPFRRLRSPRRLCAAAAVLILLLQVVKWDDYARFYHGGIQPYKSALKIIQNDMDQPGRILITRFGEKGFTYYASRLGIPKDIMEPIDIHPRDLPMIRAAKSRGRPVYFCPIIAFGESYKQEHFGVAKSGNMNYWDIPVYKYDPSRDIFAGYPRIIPIQFGDSEHEAGYRGTPPVIMRPDPDLTRWNAQENLNIMAPAEYMFNLEAAPEIPERLQIYVEAEDLPSTTTSALFLEDGPARLRLQWGGADAPPATDGLCLEIRALHPYMRAAYFERKGPVGDYDITKFEGRNFLQIRRNGSVEYDLNMVDRGNYRFDVTAVHDKPRPVFVEVLVNGAPHGVICFEKVDNTVGVKSFIAPLMDGDNRLRFNYLSDFVTAQSTSPDQYSAFIFEKFSWTPSSGKAADRGFIPVNYFLRPDVDLSFLVGPALAPKINPLWTLHENSEGEMEPDSSENALMFTISDDAKNVVITSCPLSFPRESLIFCSMDLKAEGMINHSVNVIFHFFDEQDKPLGFAYAYPTGMTGDFDWTRFPCLRAMPPHTRKCVIALSIYANSIKPGRHNEYLWVRNFQFNPGYPHPAAHPMPPGKPHSVSGK